MKPRVKICCIRSVAEAALAIRYGAAAIDLVSAMPSGPGVIAQETIAEIAATLPPGVATFLLTSRRDADSIVAQQHHSRVNTLQPVDCGRTAARTKRNWRGFLKVWKLSANEERTDALTPALSHPMGEGDSFSAGWSVERQRWPDTHPQSRNQPIAVPSPVGRERVRVRALRK